jgi:hypothetical protein
MTIPDRAASRPEQQTCCLCGNEGVRILDEGGEDDPLLHVSCNRCADYLVHETTAAHLSMVRRREGGLDQQYPELVGRLHLISGHTRELRLMGGGPVQLTLDEASAVVRAVPEHVVDRLDRLVLNLARMSPRIGRELEVRAAWDQPLGYCRDLEDLVALVVHLSEAGLIRCDRRRFAVAKEGRVALSPAGWERARELRRRPPAASRHVAFVAVFPGEEGSALFKDGIRPGVEGAGYVPRRRIPPDGRESLDTEAAAGIREVRFVVADAGEGDPGVHALAGFARGVGVPVIWTAREGALDEVRFALPPKDLITWSEPGSVAEPLRLRVLALMGRGGADGLDSGSGDS